ncbi:MAG: MaoC family dehydratase [Clostridia bacterium]|nr:MaoC family dehydratase [Clostridia bacterium]
MTPSSIGRYLEDFTAGEEIRHSLSKTVFESDNNLFSLLTMNYHPVHTNADYAAKQQHGQILVVGTLVFSLVVGMTVPDISGKAIANLDYEKIEHLAPTFIGDTLYARSVILEARPSRSKPDRGIVYVETTGYNQNGTDVIRFRRHVLVKRRPDPKVE